MYMYTYMFFVYRQKKRPDDWEPSMANVGPSPASGALQSCRGLLPEDPPRPLQHSSTSAGPRGKEIARARAHATSAGCHEAAR